MRIIYNDNDKGAAAWLSELGRTGAIPRGRVITTSITELEPGNVAQADQVHFFAGIGGWAHALELAGYADLRCWTGSPPCQPFSVAGRQRGVDDERHLAPAWLNLIRECRPDQIFGEQVADAIRHGWLDDLFDALEREGYACGAAVLPACSVGAPHIRKRLFFGAVRLADSCGEPRKRLPGRFFAAEEREHRAGEQHGPLAIRHSDGGAANRLADSVPAGWPEWRPQSGERQAPRSRSVSRLAHSDQIQRGRVSDGEGGQPDRPQTGWNESHRFSEPDMPVGRLADTESHRRNGALRGNEREGVSETMGRGIADRMADPKAQRPPYGRERSVQPLFGESSGERSWLANTDNPRPQGRAGMPERSNEQPIGPGSVESRSADPYNSFWSGADWLGCRDGKFRPVEPFPQQVVDGFSTGLGPMCDALAREAIEEIENATESCSGTEQALRNLWVQYAEEAIQWPVGRPIGFQSPQVLLTVMRELTRKGWNLGHHLLPVCWQSAEIGLREMRRPALETSGPPHIGRQIGQHSSEFTDALPILSQTIAHTARKWAINRDPLNFQADKRDNRVGRLRGYGNAIVPQIAAVFIQSFMEGVGLCR